jgi:serine/threonine protein kinase
MIGHGSFGAVFLAKVVETDEIVAIKKVFIHKPLNQLSN